MVYTHKYLKALSVLNTGVLILISDLSENEFCRDFLNTCMFAFIVSYTKTKRVYVPQQTC